MVMYVGILNNVSNGTNRRARQTVGRVLVTENNVSARKWRVERSRDVDRYTNQRAVL